MIKNNLKEISKKLNIRFPIKQISTDLNYSKGAVSEYYNNKKLMSENFIEQFENFYNVKFNEEEEATEPNTLYNLPKISEHKGVPYYDVDFHGGFDAVFNDQTVSPSYYIDFPPYNDCDAWINVTGKSMSPFISHGDIAALKLLRNWQVFFPKGEVYAIYTEEHRTIKIVTEGKDDEHLTLIPYNKSREFVEQQIPKSIIKQMFRVNGSIKKFF
tara:strand:+ start:667 stop:1308 length:642 start_codon:yes stop_codon:yes gene_type:complete